MASYSKCILHVDAYYDLHVLQNIVNRIIIPLLIITKSRTEKTSERILSEGSGKRSHII